jgi:LysM repeat protein
MDRICPYLALAIDHRTVVDSFDPDHRCHALTPPEPLERARQVSQCLVEGHRECQRFLDARHAWASSAAVAPRPSPDAFVSRTRLVLEPDESRRRRLMGDGATLGRGRRWAIGGVAAALGVAGAVSAATGGLDGVLGVSRLAPPASEAPAVTAEPTEVPTALPTVVVTASPVPTPAPTAAPTIAPTTAPSAAPAQRSYVVVAGDTLSSIASRFGTTVAALQAANGLGGSDLLSIGQVLVIP